jgi:hypothetical protein
MNLQDKSNGKPSLKLIDPAKYTKLIEQNVDNSIEHQAFDVVKWICFNVIWAFNARVYEISFFSMFFFHLKKSNTTEAVIIEVHVSTSTELAYKYKMRIEKTNGKPVCYTKATTSNIKLFRGYTPNHDFIFKNKVLFFQ